MRFHIFLAALAVLSGSAVAHADDFTFTLSGSAGGFSGTGTFSGSEQAGKPGTYDITGVSGSNTNGIIAAGQYNGNDNLLTPNASYFVDTSGISFYDQTASGVYAVRLYKSGNGYCGMDTNDPSQYCIDLQEVNTPNPGDTTLPVTFPGTSGSPARLAVRFSLARTAAEPAPAATPEPGSLMLLGTGALALAGVGRRRFSQR
ncbi:PEP-CTERM sorting domain-containing protein [Terriglobus aquaticus]|uniref:PEP-CTERM sorting domain-containing protein n=1 Tax=Terriglobus aquaticus TaxID=940139 RepID=A0ABW9KRE3_9BACT|nr:PEP-CTERM sorting domain-containing protein [Terriglobus aquaticus]